MMNMIKNSYYYYQVNKYNIIKFIYNFKIYRNRKKIERYGQTYKNKNRKLV